MGYGYEHTALAWSTSQIKQSPQEFDDARHSYLGDSSSIYSFVIIAAALARKFIPHFTFQRLAMRMGMAPGFRAHIRSVIPLCRHLAYRSLPIPESMGTLGLEQFNRMLLRRTNHTGSDIRVVTGDFTNPKVFPRQSVSAAWWTWFGRWV